MQIYFIPFKIFIYKNIDLSLLKYLICNNVDFFYKNFFFQNLISKNDMRKKTQENDNLWFDAFEYMSF